MIRLSRFTVETEGLFEPRLALEFTGSKEEIELIRTAWQKLKDWQDKEVVLKAVKTAGGTCLIVPESHVEPPTYCMTAFTTPKSNPFYKDGN